MAISLIHQGKSIHVGDTVRVNYRIIEREVVSGKTKKEKHEEKKERIQAFEGIVISIKGKDEGKSFVVRHMGAGKVGVERIFPLISPWIHSVETLKLGDIRRAKL